jgi:hypothetical protein
MVVAPPLRRHAGSRLAVSAAVIAFATDALYLGIILSQDPVEWGRVAVIAGCILVAGAIAAVAAVAGLPRATRLLLLAIAAGGLLTLGYLGLFSIGLPLLVAGILSSVAWQRVWAETGPAGARPVLPSALGFLAAALVPLAAVIAT